MKLLKCYNYDIVAQEIPNEITLALNISGCPNRCPDCHSKWLWEDEGLELTEHFLKLLVDKYYGDITCVCFMGGDQSPEQVNSLAAFIKSNFEGVKTAWYSGASDLSTSIRLSNFDFVKIGPYIAEKGGLRSPKTNQKFYKVLEGNILEEVKFSPKNAF